MNLTGAPWRSHPILFWHIKGLSNKKKEKYIVTLKKEREIYCYNKIKEPL